MKILSLDEVAEIEARAVQVKEMVGVGLFGENMLALCATVRALKAKLSALECHNADAHEDLASAWLKQDELRSQLAAVTEERNQARAEVWKAAIEVAKGELIPEPCGDTDSDFNAATRDVITALESAANGEVK